jgi:hypothetical protein
MESVHARPKVRYLRSMRFALPARVARRFLIAALFASAGWACAHGAGLPNTGGAGGGVGSGGKPITGTIGSSGVGNTTGNAGGAAGQTTTIAGTTNASTADATSATAGTGGAAPCDPTPSNTCGTAMTLPSVSGDNGGQTSTMGAGSQWVAVHITENDSSIIPAGLSYTVTLTSPSGMVYSLAVYEGGGGGGPNCNAAAMNGTPAGGGVQTVHHSWGDSLGSDDSRWINIFVNMESVTDCTAQWSLLIQGKT